MSDPDPEGPKSEQYCRQMLMIHQSFCQVDELLGACDKHSYAYHQFLRCSKVPPSLADDIHRLELEERESHSTDNDEKVKKSILSEVIILPYRYLKMKKTLKLLCSCDMIKINNNKYCP